MRIKQKPEDFSVKESYRFDEAPEGLYRVYLMDKQKLSTFEAVDRIRQRFGLRPGAISYCGLKDKQGRTEQIIAVQGAEVDIQDPDLRLKFLGRTDKKLTSANTTSNRFSVTVRSLSTEDLGQLSLSAAEVSRLGVINYFDSQRFGSLKHGQGFIAKDLLRGDFEAALKNHLAKPSPLDRSDDAKVKEYWRANWGDWSKRPPFAAAKKYDRILRSLREKPGDYLRAFLQIDADYRALLLFTYQSYLWNEGVRRLLQITLPREHLFPMQYQAGTVLFHRDCDPQALQYLREVQFPLLSPNSTFTDEKVKEAVTWVLGKEKLKLSDLQIKGAEKLLYFKHELRPVLIEPHKLVLGRQMSDELNRGSHKLNVAFTLPPGSYATLVIKRLFHFSYREETATEIRASQTGEAKTPYDADAPRARKTRVPEEPAAEQGPVLVRRTRAERPASSRPPAEPPKAAAPAPGGYLAQQRARKSAKREAQAQNSKQKR